MASAPSEKDRAIRLSTELFLRFDPKCSRHHPEVIGSDLGGPGLIEGEMLGVFGSAYFDLCGLDLSASAGPRPDGSERASRPGPLTTGGDMSLLADADRHGSDDSDFRFWRILLGLYQLAMNSQATSVPRLWTH